MLSNVLLITDLLAAKGRKGLKAEAMRELGNIHYHSKNSRYY